MNAANVPVPCAGKKKREAEPYYGLGYGYGGYGYGGYGYGLPYGLVLDSDCKNAYGLPGKGSVFTRLLLMSSKKSEFNFNFIL